MNELDIYVRLTTGGYTTNTVRKQRSSATMSAEAAAQRQAEKLFGPALQNVRLVDQTGHTASVWRATADADVYAWCWATGLIEFGTEVPEDARCFAKGPERALKQIVAVKARQGRSAHELLVPGVPEAKNQHDGMDALLIWEDWCMKHNGSPDGYGVVFGPSARAGG